ncbi:N-acetyl-glucosamine-6-phosphate deacetylase [Exophiala dermatitidis]|uniref:N-acetylglucosamine-6-phosphate deacetylase n=2 Tax=Exophiala dermatitidis TaxID=5970 RepID=H6C675_EXODN|nr:N-acetylglucosamine-6-phosphate deacetylase [Exophiala dermatitidis NIH/UT8656]KAJ4522996.1 N-acetyl-glucosamine-6-phosphate deacetylase [Exophiala dermatitidis]EHY59221.1 N-acetylglucosamine-6-phosphate deacetylase [Exophiala dermatitidis NIH/UT8656]KAJ4526318.1 N-acetyl-glucosamine-6-phosphate deacetylase [Exophiala dermatitidis]KAJ4526739.1 N-acetyl-glucosamine-6-phosphate deacetylase [Exophiala dermatitidis]KAJ4532444.1 N-acetyl-glucosamine-6-phosphate deacetylase [Exophiala dermatitidi
MPASTPRVIKFTNGYLLEDGRLVPGDLWISSETGRIISPQAAFYSAHLTPDRVVDLDGRILSPGFIDVQINGCYNFDFSTPDPEYSSKLAHTHRQMIKSGLTSYVPTVISTTPEAYHSVLPHLGPSGKERDASKGCESLGAHIEGPFLSPIRNGIHNPEVLREAHSWTDIEACYGRDNLRHVRYITAAPERGNMISFIPEFVARGIVFAIGHSDATFEQAQAAIAAGASMVTHLFNAMRPFAHREPGIFGLLGQSAPSTPLATPKHSRPASATTSPRGSPNSSRRTTPRSSLSISTSASDLEEEARYVQPFFGLIADGIHLSAQALKIAYSAHPEGAILVTDAQKLAGCPDGKYDWRGEDHLVKEGKVLKLGSNGRIAGSVADLVDCVNNFNRFTGCGLAKALQCVTSTPAKMLGKDVEQSKGKLEVGMDADLVVLEEGPTGDVTVQQVWKFGVQVA